MTNSLSFENNWRRLLIMTKEASENAYSDAEYISLDESKLPMKVSKFCKAHWNEFGFDYDTYSYLLWSVNGDNDIKQLQARLNEKFPKCATIVKKTPMDAHGLEFNDNELSF